MDESPVATEPSALGVRREQQAWRERTLRGVSLTLIPCIAAVALWYAIITNPAPELFVVLMGAALMLGATVLVPRVPFALRTALTLGILYVASMSALLRVGYGPNAFVMFALVCFLGALLLGRRVGLGLVALCTLTLTAIAYAHGTHLIERAQGWETVLDDAVPANTLRVVGTFCLAATVFVTAVSYVLSRAEELALAKERSLETLRREQAERERMARDLELREAAFHKARELELLGRLAGTMAHDFNNALLVIWATLDELEHVPYLPPQAHESIADLRTAAEQASATTKQLKAFGPMAPRRPSELALTPLVEKAKTMFMRVLPVNIALETDLRLDAVILADEGEVLRVLMNLALNARDAMRDGGKLILRVRPPLESESKVALPDSPESALLTKTPAGTAVIEVEDNGSGMSDDVKNRIFEPFFTTKQASGTGLGLASVRDLLVSHGGRIDVKSEPGKGTTISLFWPAIERSPVISRPSNAAAPSEPVVVLLVDDDEAVRLVLRRSLVRAGMTVLDAADGNTALTLARRHQAPIQILCTDCVMPGPPVRQLIAAFRELHPGRVLVCSGYAPAETGLTPEVFDDFLPKPFSGETLVERIVALVSATR